MLAENDPFVVGVQSLGEVTENEGIEEVEKTGKEAKGNENPHHGNVHSVEVLGVEDGHEEDPELANGCTYDTGNGEFGLFGGNVGLEFDGGTEIVLHDQGSHEEDGLEPGT